MAIFKKTGGYKVGFFGLLKKKEEFPLDSSLDIPPTPPPDRTKEEKEMPESYVSEEEFPSKVKEAKSSVLPKQEEVIELPSFHGIEEDLPEFSSPPVTEEKVKAPELKHAFKPEHIHRLEKQKVREAEKIAPKEVIRVQPTHPLKLQKVEERKEIGIKKERAVEPLFISIDNFKNILNDIANIKTNLRDFEGFLLGLDEEKKEKDGLYEKWRNSLNDIQKKIKFVDQTLFKG